MKEIIDLTGKLENGLWGYDVLPGLEKIIPPVKIDAIATVKKDGFFASSISFSSISGTYLEAGSHILEGGETLDACPVERFIRPVKILRLPKQRSKALIGYELLKAHAPKLEKGDALIIDTGWGERWNKPGYLLDCPNFLSNSLEWILDQKVSILGVDVPCIEASWSEGDDETKGGLLGKLFEGGTLLLAPLVNLAKVTADSGTLICLPLFVGATSGAPVRVIYVKE